MPLRRRRSSEVSASPTVVADARVLITGAAQGMGRLYALRAQAEGAATLDLWDINGEALAAVAAELAALNPATTVHTTVVDVSDQHAVQQAAAEQHARSGGVDILINNAGIVRAGWFWENDPAADIDATMIINALAPMWLTRAVINDMITETHREKRILTIASAAGTLANPGMAVYAASKWSLIGWAESLRLELQKNSYDHIGVTTFCPSYISTGMFAGVRGPLLTPIMTPEQAVEKAWTGMLNRTELVTTPWTVKMAMASRGVLPTKVWDVIAGKVFKVYSSMDTFRGHGA